MMEVCMTLNIAISGRDSGNGQLMVDPVGRNSPLPMDVARIIFQNLKADLPSVALVCKNWKALADDEVFRKMIRPPQAFGSKEWNDYIKVDAGIELPLPRRAYGDLENDDGLLTFIPESVKVIKNGEKVSLDSLEAIGDLAKKPITDLTSSNNYDSWPDIIKEIIKLEKPHWVWIKKEVIGRNLQYSEQQELARKENSMACGANISGLIDTAVSVIMEYVRTKERNFMWNPLRGEGTFVRVNDKVHGCHPLGLFFAPTAGLGIGYWNNSLVGIVIARKYFGACS